MQLAELKSQMLGSRENIGHRVEVEYREALSREGMLNKAVVRPKPSSIA